MNQRTWQIRGVSAWFGAAIIGFLVLMLTKCSIETIILMTNADYAIAQVIKVYGGSKMEPRISYRYLVNGTVYTSGAEWDEPIHIGDRFVVRYGQFAPNGNKPVYDLPVPDSIRQDTGRVWNQFLLKNHLWSAPHTH
jgi:hypothetical protein